MSYSHATFLDDRYLLLGISSFIGIFVGLIIRKMRTENGKRSIPKHFYPRKFKGVVECISKSSGNNRRFQSLSDESEYRLSVIIPAYNEEQRLKNMLEDTLKVLKSKVNSDREFNCEIILVDDGSKDGTVDEYKRIVSTFGNIEKIEFKLLKLKINSGKGRAVSEGMLSSLGENIIFADADGSTDFEALNRFEKYTEKGTGDVLICGSRCHLKSDTESIVKRSIFRLYLMKAFHSYLKIFGVKSVSDTQCGFKMLNRSAAQKIIPWIHISGWIFDVEMILLAEWKGIRIIEVPVSWKEMNGTKLRIAVDSIKMAKDLLCIRLNYFLRVWKCEN